MILIRRNRNAGVPAAKLSRALGPAAAALVLLLAAIPVFPACARGIVPAQESRARQILAEALAKAEDRAALEGFLSQIEAEIKARPDLSENLYAAGRILSLLGRQEEALTSFDRALKADPTMASAAYNAGVVLAGLGRDEEALTSYDRALKADPTMASAAYNAGVVLAGLGRDTEAIERWKTAVAIDPQAVDALYNLGQVYYNRKEFIEAVVCWSKAREIAPSDFDIAKKVLQAVNALGQLAAAAKAREAVFDLWRTSDDPEVRELREYVFDQFDVGPLHIYAFETFEPKGDFYGIYAFKAAGPDNRIVATVHLESNPSLREAGTPYIIGVTAGGEHRTLDMTFKDLPSYDVLKPLVVKVIEDNIAKKLPSPATSL